MALLTGSDVLETAFTPAVGTFLVQATGGVAVLERRNVTGITWARLQPTLDGTSSVGNAFNVDNPIASVEYRFVALNGTAPSVRADQ